MADPTTSSPGPAPPVRGWWSYAELIAAFPAVLLVIAFRDGLPWAPRGEPPRYFEFAGQLLHGALPYRDLPLEYPPLAVVSWVLPRLLSGPDVGAYAWWLAIENAALAAGTALCLLALARSRWPTGTPPSTVLAIGLLVLLAAAPIVVWLFDLVAVLLIGIALVAVTRDRPGIAGVALGLGTLVKLYPAVLVPILAIWLLTTYRRPAAIRLVAGWFVTCFLVMGVTLLLVGTQGLGFVDYQSARGLQLESLPAGLVMAIGLLGGQPPTVIHDFGAWGLASPLADGLAAIQPVALLLTLLLLFGACALRFRQDHELTGTVSGTRLVGYLMAALLLVLVVSKVLSPQFLIWLLPLAALLPRAQAGLAVAASLVTVVLLGDDYVGMIRQHADLVLLLNLRNLLLVLLLAWIVIANAPSLRLRHVSR